MAARKDNKGRALRNGEYQRASDGRYVYEYNDPFGKRRSIYSTYAIYDGKPRPNAFAKGKVSSIPSV